MNVNYRPSPADIIIWPCGTACLRDELYQFGYMSDDYQVVSYHDEPAYEAAWNLYMPVESQCLTQSRVDALNAAREQELQS